MTRLPPETVAFQPFIHGVDAIRVRRHERLDVRLRQVFSVARVERIADFREVLLELGEALLRKRDAERDDVGGWCAPHIEPVAWDRDALAQFESLRSSADDDARHGGGEQKEVTGNGGDAHSDTLLEDGGARRG